VPLNKIKTSVADGVATVTFADPATLNAASVALVREVSEILQAYATPGSGVRCVVLTGEGRGFCSGADLSPNSGDPTMDDPGTVMERVYNPFMRLLRDYALPLVSAVNGPAAGIGCSIALACDLVVAAESGYFLQAFRRIGLVPDGGATYALARLVGKARALEMALLGEKLPARQALDWGLINRCVPDAELLPTALGLARTLAEGPRALGLTRQLINRGLDSDLSSQLDAERDAQEICRHTADFAEGVAAFREKRPARFTGA
jgi:2-(1,2-epoxy-1,2-dihydrophenyl)acetyl-CoA isomerase